MSLGPERSNGEKGQADSGQANQQRVVDEVSALVDQELYEFRCDLNGFPKNPRWDSLGEALDTFAKIRERDFKFQDGVSSDLGLQGLLPSAHDLADFAHIGDGAAELIDFFEDPAKLVELLSRVDADQIANLSVSYKGASFTTEEIFRYSASQNAVNSAALVWLHFSYDDMQDALALHSVTQGGRGSRNIVYLAQQSLEKLLKGGAIAMNPALNPRSFGHSVENAANGLVELLVEDGHHVYFSADALRRVEGLDVKFRYPRPSEEFSPLSREEIAAVLCHSLQTLQNIHASLQVMLRSCVIQKRINERKASGA